MYYLLAKHKVADFAKWRRIFDCHAKAHRKAGLHLLHLLRDTADPNLVIILFRADDLDKARAFTQAPEASKAGL
jgi:heme-degrading monooxygenase HmoA